ncbi:hypothetical protein [Microbacterium deminutum]|uniref:Uncharacterized protein n=1 Tax=Microbacterium deminutum TaxID=344164 RepID=A0ABN2Q9P2_9MICO
MSVAISSVGATVPTGEPTDPRDLEQGARPKGQVLWPVIAVVVTVLVAASRVLVTPAFYFADDTQTGTAGQWWRLGGDLLSGQLPVLDPHAWTAGNYLAEGQWGLYNPVIWVIAICTRLSDDPVAAITTVKILALGAMCLGSYLLARSFDASRPWSAAAGVLVPLGGFTVYMDAPSWTTGLLNVAVLPWAWWALRRLVEQGRGPLPYLLTTSVLVTFGYIFGVIVLIVVLGESLIRAAVQRDRRRILTVLAAGGFAALLTVTVYLPGVLTAPVTIRNSSAIVNSGFLNADLTDVLAASTATVTASIHSWGTEATTAPLMYVLWALPALTFFRPSRQLQLRLIPLLIVGSVLLLTVTAPDQIGPIRWPVRFIPYLVLVVVVGFAAIASEGRRARSPRAALAGAMAILAGASWVSAVNTPWEWRQVAIAGLVQAVGLTALWFVVFRAVPKRIPVRSVSALIAAGIGVILVAPQLYFFPATPLPRLPVQNDTSAMNAVPGGVTDDVIVVGNIYAGWQGAATYAERLVANQWYFSHATVSSLYTVLPYRTYVTDLCADLRGATCAKALDTLMSIDSHTRTQVATLLGVNSILVMKDSFPKGLPALPTGWRVADDEAYTWTLSRDRPIPTAGGVAWTSAATRVETIAESSTGITLRVDEIGPSPEVVLSRLAWPGYSVAGAQLADSTRGYLLTLDMSSAKVGDTITLQFRAPGWTVEMISLAIAVAALLAWPIASAVLRRRATSRLRAKAATP